MMRYFLVNLIMKGIQLLQDRRIIHARFGEILKLGNQKERLKNDD